MKSDATPRQPELAEVSREDTDGDTTVIFVRHFPSAPSAVWAEVTDPARLALWAPHTADRDLSATGAVVFTMLGDDDPDGVPSFDVPGHVLVSDRPYELEHTWATDVLDWRLQSDEDARGTTLTLRHRLTDAAMASAVAAGWHLCLDVAEDAMAGRSTTPVRGMAAMQHGWSQLNERYAEVLGVTPSRLES
jgi:uncharacterized protein YndB with AHSA1/START domain